MRPKGLSWCILLTAVLSTAALPLACGPNYNHNPSVWNPVSPNPPAGGTPTPFYVYNRTFGDTGYPGTGNGQFQRPSGVAYYNNYVFVADWIRDNIQKFDYNGNYMATYSGGGFDGPVGMAFNRLNLLYVADSGNDRIQILDNNGNYLASFGSTGAALGQFDNPLGLALDAASNVYVADNGNSRLQKCGPDGADCVTVGGFTAITGVAVDVSGNVWVVDAAAKKVMKFDYNLAPVTQFGTAGTEPGQFSQPYGITVDSVGNLIVTDSGNSNVQVFSPAGAYLTSVGIQGPGSGPGQFDNPTLAAFSGRYLFVSDTDNYSVIMFYSYYY